MQNYHTMQRKDVITHKPFGIEGNHQNTRGFRRTFKVECYSPSNLALGFCFEHNVLSVSKLKALFVIFQIVALN